MEKIILVDCVYCFFIEGEGIFKEMQDMLDGFPNRKIILTNANEETMKELGVTNMHMNFLL